MASRMTGGWMAKLRKEHLSFFVVVLGLGLFLLALLVGAPLLQQDSKGTADGGELAEDSPARMVSDPQIPADFLPEKLHMPELPDPTERALDQQQDLSAKESENTQVVGPILDGLRVDTVGLRTPQDIQQVAFALPDAPDQIAPGMISMRRFGERTGRSGTSGRRGGGGIGGGGFGDGPRCHPRRPGDLRDPRNPIGGPLPLIGRTIVYRR